MQTPLDYLAARLNAECYYLDCYPHARAIAELGTDEAFEYLVAHADDDGPVAEACGSALSDLGEQVQSCVIAGLLQHPDSVLLAEALPQPAPDAVIDAIAETLRRSNSPAVFRELGAQVQRSEHQRASELEAIVEQRNDETLLAAFRIGGLSAREEFETTAVVPYLDPDRPLEVWSAALEIEGLADLPEAEECLRRALESSDDRERDTALRIVNRNGLIQLADAVAVVAIEDPDPQRRGRALDTLRWLPDCPEHVIEATLEQLTEGLQPAMAKLPYTLLEALRDGEDMQAPVDAALRQIHHTSVAASMALNSSHGTSGALAQSLHGLLGSAMDLVPWSRLTPIADRILPVTEALVELQVKSLSAMRRMAVPEVLEPLMLTAGWPIPLRFPEDIREARRAAADSVDADGDDGDDGDDEPWPARLQNMQEAATKLAEAQLSYLPPPGTPGLTPHPLGSCFVWNTELRQTVADAMKASQSAAEVTTALRSSQQREHHARKALLRAIGPKRLPALLQTWNLVPVSVGSTPPELLRHVIREASPLSAREFPLAAKLFAEYNLQCVLLSALLPVVDSPNLSVVLGRLDSDCPLVYDNVQAVLIAVGTDALPAIEAAMAKTDDPMKQAIMLEAARCIDAAECMEQARQHLEGPNDLLAAVSARIIGEAGVPEDVPALVTRMATGNEILGASVVWAIGELDPQSYVDVLKSAVVSPHAAVRDAAQLALGRCSNETLAPIIEEFTASGHIMRLNAAERLATVDSWRDDPTIFRRAGVERRFPLSYPGPRLSVPGDGPWQWSILTSTPDVHEHLQRFAPLVADYLEFAEAWDFYTVLHLLPSTLIDTLVDLCAPEQPHRALATELLNQVLTYELLVVDAAYGTYSHTSEARVPEHDDTAQIVDRVAAACTAEARRSLLDVQAALRMEGAETDDSETDAHDDPLRTITALLYLIVKETAPTAAPEALPEEDRERLEAIARWWSRLETFADQRLGFLVAPVPSVEDLSWYVSHPDADSGTRRSIFNYLLALVNHLPCEPETRRAALATVQDVFAPMLERAAAVLVSRGEHSEQEAAAAVADELYITVTDPELFDTARSIISLLEDTPPVLRKADAPVLPSGMKHLHRFWVELAYLLQDALESKVAELAGAEARAELSEAFRAHDHWAVSVDLQRTHGRNDPEDVDNAVWHVVERHSSKLNVGGLQQEAIELEVLKQKLNLDTEEALEVVGCDAGAIVDQDGRRYLLLDPVPYLPQTGAEPAD